MNGTGSGKVGVTGGATRRLYCVRETGPGNVTGQGDGRRGKGVSRGTG